MHDNLRHVYVLVREDIPKRHQAVQATHAGISAGRTLIPTTEQHPNLVVLTVPDEAELLRMRDRVHDCELRFEIFREADMRDEHTALATEPLGPENRRLFEKLPLLN